LLDVQPFCSAYNAAETVGTDREGSKHLWKRTQEETLEVRRERKFSTEIRAGKQRPI
jgi:hypothetical protein